MKVELNLPTPVIDYLNRRAKAVQLTLEEYVVDHLTAIAFAAAARGAGPFGSATAPSPHGATLEGVAGKRTFIVSTEIPGVGGGSSALAQRFVDVMLQYEGMTAQASQAGGVLFSDNFAHIERVYTRDSGFIASFYGEPMAFKSANPFIGRGRGDSYSRMTVRNEDELDAAIRSIPIAHRLKHGPRA